MDKYPQVLHINDRKHGSEYRLLDCDFDMYYECLLLIKNNLNNDYYTDLIEHYSKYDSFEEYVEKDKGFTVQDYYMLPQRFKQHLKPNILLNEEAINHFNDYKKLSELLLMINNITDEDLANEEKIENLLDDQEIWKAIKRIIQSLHTSMDSQCKVNIEIFNNIDYSE